MTELFRGYEEEFISSITTIGKQVESIPLLTNRTPAPTQTKRNWPSTISRPISPSARRASS